MTIATPGGDVLERELQKHRGNAVRRHCHECPADIAHAPATLTRDAPATSSPRVYHRTYAFCMKARRQTTGELMIEKIHNDQQAARIDIRFALLMSAAYRSAASRAASNSSFVAKASNLAATLPSASMTNVHGSVGSPQSIMA